VQRLALLGLAAALLMWAPAPAYASGESTSLTAGTTSADVAFRSAFGLRTDGPWLQQVSALGADPTWGVPLSTAEVADLNGRVEIARAAGSLSRYAGESWYGGAWLDQASGGTVVVNVRGELPVSISDLMAGIPAPASLRLRSVSFALADLRALDATLYDTLTGPVGHQLGVNDFGVDVIANHLRIGVDNASPSVVAALFALAPTDAIEVVVEGPSHAVYCTDATACGSPMKGGLKITSLSVQTTSCSSGFMARPVGTYGSGHSWMITSGHCAYDAQTVLGATNFAHGGGVWNGAIRAVWDYNNAPVDAAILESVVGQTDTPANYIFTGSTTSFQSIVSIMNDDQQLPGTPECKYGYVGGKVCGQVLQTSTTVSNICSSHGHCVTIQHLWLFSGAAKSGDSGGPLYSTKYADGIVVAQTNDLLHTWYSTIGGVILATGFRPCYATTYPC